MSSAVSGIKTTFRDELARAALFYAGRHSFAVFPCKPRSKAPLAVHGCKSATLESKQIRAWWERHPEANVAIATGAPSGIVVLDVDPRHGGDKSLSELQRKYSPLPRAPRVLTGGGGLHLYFAHPGGLVPNSAGRIANGIDVRGDGGYVVAPPSIHLSGQPYCWDPEARIDKVALPEIPRWLLDLALNTNARVTGNATTEIKEGSRNTELYRVARSLHARGTGADGILGEILTINLERCRPPLSEDEVRKIASNAATQPDASNFEPRLGPEMSSLANLSAMEYDRARRSTAKQMGIRVQTLDEAVAAARKKPSSLSERVALAPPAPVPSNEPVEGLQLFENLRAYITRFVVISEAEAIALTLWVIFTYLLDVAEVSPRLAIQSPTKQCGKTTVLGLLAALANRSIAASNISPSAVFRTIDAEHPTLLVDEADSFARGNEELRGILNSGHTRATAYVIRNVKSDDDLTPRKFSTWAAIAIACIGWLPDTWLDRSVVISMKRKPRSRRVERFRRRNTKVYSQAESLAREISRWAADNRELIGAAEPQMPDSLDDRAADNWEILIAMADLVGGTWPALARDAAVQLSANRERAASVGELLLADIEREFASRSSSRDRLTSSELCTALAAREGRPWPEYGQARKPISPNQLARRLAPFNVFPRSIRIGNATAKGYLRSDFRDAFSRYLPQQTGTSSLLFSEKESSSLRSGTSDLDSSAKDVRYARGAKDDHVVTDQEQRNSEAGGRA